MVDDIKWDCEYECVLTFVQVLMYVCAFGGQKSILDVSFWSCLFLGGGGSLSLIRVKMAG